MNDAGDGKLRGLTAFVGAVELCAVNQRAFVINRDSVVRRGQCASAGSQHNVLQTVGQRLDAGIIFVGGEKRVTVRFIFGRFLGAEFLLETGEHLLRFFRRQQRRAAGLDGFDGGGSDVRVNVQALLLPVMTEHHANGVADARFFIAQHIGSLGQNHGGETQADNSSKNNFFHTIDLRTSIILDSSDKGNPLFVQNERATPTGLKVEGIGDVVFELRQRGIRRQRRGRECVHRVVIVLDMFDAKTFPKTPT